MKGLFFAVVTFLFIQSALAENDGIVPTTCENVLPADTCNQLREVARTFHEKIGIVNKAVVDAFNHHKTKAAEILLYVKQYLVDKATNFKCEDVLSAESCTKIDEIATKLKMKHAEVTKVVKEAIVAGAAQVKMIYERALGFLLNDAKNLKCEDLLPADQCNKIDEYAKNLHLKISDATKAVKEAIIQGASTIKDIHSKAIEYLQAQTSCDQFFQPATCTKIQSIADKFRVSLTKVNAFIADAFANGVTSVKTLYIKALKFIKDYWLAFGDEPAMHKRSIDAADERMSQALDMLLDAMVDEASL